MGFIISVIMIFGMIYVLYAAISPALLGLRAHEIIRSWKLTPAQQHTLDRSLTGALWILTPTTLWLFGCLNRDMALMLRSGFPPVPTVATTTPHGPLTIGQMGQKYQTLFADESDGALDTAKKEQFVKMKRTVLELGGYEREIFITHTPELWDLADVVIDIERL